MKARSRALYGLIAASTIPNSTTAFLVGPYPRATPPSIGIKIYTPPLTITALRSKPPLHNDILEATKGIPFTTYIKKRPILKRILGRFILGASAVLFTITFASSANAASTSGSIRPFVVDKNGNKILLSQLANPNLHLRPEPMTMSLRVVQFLQSFVSFGRTFLSLLGGPFTRRYLCFFVLLPAFLTKTGLRNGQRKAVKGTSINSLATQNFLESKPYWSRENVVEDTYTTSNVLKGKIISTKKIVGPVTAGETCHITINHGGKMKVREGQSLGVIPPGVDKDGKPHSARLYSNASSRYGDNKKGKTASLCVKRATYWCPDLQTFDPAKKGTCSNYLCDTQCGDRVQITGPHGNTMLLPEEDPTKDYIMVGTGTGVAPYRAFIRRLFVENTKISYAYKGQVWLFLNPDELLYDNEFRDIQKDYPDNFHLFYATNKAGTEMDIQSQMKDCAHDIFDKLENGSHIFFSGLKDIMPGILDMFQSIAVERGVDYQGWCQDLKDKGQWHEEVY